MLDSHRCSDVAESLRHLSTESNLVLDSCSCYEGAVAEAIYFNHLLQLYKLRGNSIANQRSPNSLSIVMQVPKKSL